MSHHSNFSASRLFFFYFPSLVPSGFTEFLASPNTHRGQLRVRYRVFSKPEARAEGQWNQRIRNAFCTQCPFGLHSAAVILPIWSFLSRGRKSPRARLVCETVGSAARIAARHPGEKRLTDGLNVIYKTD